MLDRPRVSKHLAMYRFLSFLSFVLLTSINLQSQDTLITTDPNLIAKFREFRFSTVSDNLIMVSSEQGTNTNVKVWDDHFRLEKFIPVVNRKTHEIALSPNGRYLVKTISDSKFEIWDIQHDKLITTGESLLDIRTMAFSPDGNELAIAGYFLNPYARNGGFGGTTKSGVIDLIDFSKAAQGQINRSYKSIKGFQCVYVGYSPDGKYLVGVHPADDEPNILVWNAKTGKKINFIHTNERYILRAKFIPGTSHLIYNGSKNFHVVNFLTKKPVKKFAKMNSSSSQFDINKKGQFLAPTLSGFKVTDLKSARPFWAVKLDDPVVTLQFHPVKPFVFFTSENGSIGIWDYQKKKEVFNIVSTKDSDGYGLFTPQGHYFGSKEGVKAFVIQTNNKDHSYEKFDKILNRPDILFTRLPNPDPNIIEEYKALVQQRIQWMDNDIPMPTIAFANQVEFKDTQKTKDKKGKILLYIELFGLEKNGDFLVDVMINKKPAIPTLNKSLKPKQTLVSPVTVQLSEGDNLVEVIVSTKDGSHSITKKENIFYPRSAPAKTPAKISSKTSSKQNIHFVGVGVSDYQNFGDLNFAHKDIEDLATFFKKTATDDIELHTTTILNEMATQSRLQQLKQDLAMLNEDDLLILYFSGHGTFNYQGVWCFVPHDFDDKKTGITDQDINNILKTCPASKKIAFIDACQAGEQLTTQPIQSIVFNENGQSKGAVEDSDTEAKDCLDQTTLEKLKQTFNDLRNDSGAIIIAASRGKEEAIESPKYSNGLFTYFLLKALNSIIADTNLDQQVSATELVAYIYDELEKLDDGKICQRPNFKRIPPGLDFNIWKRTRTKVEYDKLFSE